MKGAAKEWRSAASAGAIALDGAGVPPKQIQLLRLGDNPARDGKRIFKLVDQAHAEQVLAASRALLGATDMVIDYDHQSVFGARDGVGGQAKAAGWIKTLSVGDAGIMAEVEWTPAAARALTDQEYRYISPYFGHDASGRVTRIFNAALTNRPELELQAVASAAFGMDDETGETDLMKQIATALGLAADASPDDMMAALAALMSTTASAKTERAAICTALGLGGSAGLDEIRTAAAARAPDLTQFVPRAEFDKIKSEVDAIAEQRITASVDAAIAGGKIAPASRDWALGYARKDATGFATFTGSAPVIVAQGPEERTAAAIAAGVLTPEEKAVCMMMRMDEAAFIKSRKEFVH